MTEPTFPPAAPGIPDPQSSLGHDLAALIEHTPNVRLWVPPPFDRLPALPGQPPAGIQIGHDQIHIHLAVDTVDVLAISTNLCRSASDLVAASGYNHNEIHLHIDQLDGNPFPPDRAR